MRALVAMALLACGGPAPRLNRADGGAFFEWACPHLAEHCGPPPGWCVWCSPVVEHPDGTCSADVCLCKRASEAGTCPPLFP